MTKLFEIFTTQEQLVIKNRAIDLLFGYPNQETKTYRYRSYDGIRKPDGTEWAGIVGEDLIKACNKMTKEERLNYYDDSDLKTNEWLHDNGWFAVMDIQPSNHKKETA